MKLILTNIKLGILLMAMMLPILLDAQGFKVSSDRSEVEVGGVVRVTYSFENVKAEDFNPPNFSPFEAYGPSTSTNRSWINGKVSQKTSYTYTLKATKEGQFKIPAGVAKIEGKVQKSQSISILVTPRSSTPGNNNSNNQQQPQSNDIHDQISDNLFMRAIPSKTTVYEGEQITMTYKLYYTVDLSDLSMSKMPSYDGFLSYDIDLSEDKKSRKIETYNGKNYYAQVIHEMALFPNKAGTYSIEPMELKTVVMIQQNDPGFFFPRTERIRYDFKSSAATIKVLPLPSGRPPGFTGAVGQLNFSATYDKTETKVGDPITLKVKVSGNGNIKLIEVPTPEFPQSFEVYDPKIKESVSSKSYTVNGTKTFEYLIIPGGGGTFKLPDLTFSYFDPQKEQYISKTEEGPEIFVEGDAIDQQNYTAGNISKEEVELLGNDIRYIKTTRSNATLAGSHLITRPIFHILTWVPLFLAMFLPFFYSRRKKLQKNSDLVRSKKAHKVASKKMRTARKLMHTGDDKAFYNEVIKAFWSYVADKFSVPAADLSKEKISSLFEHQSIDPELTSKALQLVGKCEMAIYAPMTIEESKEAIVAKASELIQQIENSTTVK